MECHVHPTASLQIWPGLHTNTQHCLWRKYRLYYKTWRLFNLLEKLFTGRTVKTSHFYIITSRGEQIFVLYTLIWTYLSMAPGRRNQKKRWSHILTFEVRTGIGQSLQWLATGWTVRGSNPGRGEILRTRPGRLWGPTNLLYNGYRVFLGGKAAGAWRWPPTPSSAKVREWAELFLYYTPGLSWSVIRWNLPFTFTLLAERNVDRICTSGC
jgi:hypothetical protein